MWLVVLELFLRNNVLEKVHNVNKTESSRNNSSVPQSRSHKASLVMPKISRGDSYKHTPVPKRHLKPYQDTHNFQWGESENKRSRNSSTGKNYFTTGSKNIRQNSSDQASKFIKSQNDQTSSKCSDGFKELEHFTFAKQSPILK